MKTELCLKFEFHASHALSVREEPHPHLWKVEIRIQGHPQNGMIINMPALRDSVQIRLNQLNSTFLNSNSILPLSVQSAPTCETLGAYLYQEFQVVLQNEFVPLNPSLHLSSVEVAICEEDGFEWGSAKLYT